MIKYAKHLNNVKRIRGSYPTEPIRLNSAERTSSIPDKIWKEYLSRLSETDIRYYPDVDHVTSIIAKFVDVDFNCVTVGHGSDNIIKNVFEILRCEDCNVVMPELCFPMYDVYARMMNYDTRKVPYKNKKIDIQGIIDCIDDKTSLVVFSNPNSPVGDSLSFSDIEAITEKARKHNATVLIDEAYIEFSEASSLIRLAPNYTNVIVTRTFSKAIGAAGIRFGYAVANSELIMLVNKVKSIYEVTGPTLRWIETVIDNWHMVEQYVAQVNNNKIKIEWMLISRGYDVLTSECNWVHTTKNYFPSYIATKQCTLPWDERTWTRLCIPDDLTLLDEII